MAKKKTAASDTTPSARHAPATAQRDRHAPAWHRTRVDSGQNGGRRTAHDPTLRRNRRGGLSPLPQPRRRRTARDFDDWVEAERDAARSRSAQLPTPNPKSQIRDPLGSWSVGIGIWAGFAPPAHGTCTLERLDRVRSRQHPGRAAYRRPRFPPALPHASRRRQVAGQVRAGLRARRQAGRVGRAGQGLRVREGPLRRPDEGRLPGRGAREEPHGRHPQLRQGRGDRRPVLRDVVLPDARQGRRARLRAAARGHPRHRARRHRDDRPARRAAPGRARSRQATPWC